MPPFIITSFLCSFETESKIILVSYSSIPCNFNSNQLAPNSEALPSGSELQYSRQPRPLRLPEISLNTRDMIPTSAYLTNVHIWRLTNIIFIIETLNSKTKPKLQAVSVSPTNEAPSSIELSHQNFLSFWNLSSSRPQATVHICKSIGLQVSVKRQVRNFSHDEHFSRAEKIESLV